MTLINLVIHSKPAMLVLFQKSIVLIFDALHLIHVTNLPPPHLGNIEPLDTKNDKKHSPDLSSEGAVKPMLLGLYKNVAAPVTDPLKIHYFWSIRHTPINIFEESEKHRVKQ
ncbi:hypothetical protein H5410_030299 [Solanum commersonii]|uniref:Uncharacterized protein n=1 Tax=Solanum commersonii TaxID=4109 RepID=A0A9J5YF98_SOLCO|nr:hypothetical protein H5410_030299 [Solanum commersonii]